jgi:4a-hydroxytetrahydrobiopterin dehydratase
MNKVADWVRNEDRLYKCFIFDDFTQAFSFMLRVAIESEKMNHHPTWTNTWNKVEIWLTTHDEGNRITDKDWDLAARIEAIK